MTTKEMRSAVVGVITDRDVCIALLWNKHLTPSHVQVEAVMSAPVSICLVDEAVDV